MWICADSMFYKYNNEGILVESYFVLWEDYPDTTPRLIARGFYEYDDSNNTQIIISQSLNNNEWRNGYKTFLVRNEKNSVLQQLDQIWSGDKWINDLRTVREYDSSNNHTYHGYQYWNSEDWQTYTDYHYFNKYDSIGNLIETNCYEQYYFFYKYDDKNRLIESIEQKKLGNNWVNSEKIIYDYNKHIDLPNSTDIVKLHKKEFYIYPNPFHQTINIKFSETQRSCSISIVNNLGNEVYNSEINAKCENKTINLYGQPPGVYYLILKDGKQVYTEKLIKAGE